MAVNIEYLLSLKDEMTAHLQDGGKAAAELDKALGQLKGKTEDHSKATVDSGKKLNDLKGILSERLAPALAMVSPQLSMAAANMGRLASVSSLAGAAGGPLLVVAGGLLAVVGGAAAMVAAVRGADEALERLAAFKGLEGLGFSEAQIASIKSANAALDAGGRIVDAFVVQLGAEFAPVVEKTATVVLAFGLMGLDAFRAFAEGHDVLRELAVFLVDVLFQAILMPASAFTTLIDVVGKAASVLGMDGLGKALQDVAKGYDDFTRSVAEGAVDFYFGQASDGLSGLTDMAGNYIDRAKVLIDTQETVNATLDKTKTKAEEAGKALADIGKTTTSTTSTAALNKLVAAMNASQTDMSYSGGGFSTEGASKVVGVAGAVASGSTAQVVSQLGSIGGLIGAILSILEQIGQGTIGNTIEESNNNIIRGIEKLPDLVSEILPELMGEFTGALVEALIQLLPKLPGIIVEAIANSVGYLAEALATAIQDLLSDFWDGLKNDTGNTIGNVLTGGIYGVIAEQTPSFDIGGLMPWDGLARLHKGERVVPANGAASGTTAAQRSVFAGAVGTSIHIHSSGPIHPVFAEAFVKDLERYYGRSKLMKSSLFQGA